MIGGEQVIPHRESMQLAAGANGDAGAAIARQTAQQSREADRQSREAAALRAAVERQRQETARATRNTFWRKRA